MPISGVCPHCASKIRIPDNLAGRQGHCPKCKWPIRVHHKTPTSDALAFFTGYRSLVLVGAAVLVITCCIGLAVLTHGSGSKSGSADKAPVA